MTISLKLYPAEFMGLMSAMARFWTTFRQNRSLVNATASDLILMEYCQRLRGGLIYNRWRQKRPHRQYPYAMKACQVRAIWEYLHFQGVQFESEQMLLDKLNAALTNLQLSEHDLF